MSDTFALKYVLSCCAATTAEIATYPLDLTKTRLQIQGEKNVQITSKTSTKQLGMVKTAMGILKDEGLLKLWQGCTPAVVRHYVYTGVRMVVYEHLRENLFHKDSHGQFPLWKAMASGATSGVVAQFLASPTDLIKVQMQMEGRRRLEGLAPRVHSMWQAVTMVVQKGGVFSLWKGWVPNCQRAALVNMADLATYDKVKHSILRHTSLPDNYVTHGLSSICSGLAAAIMSTPADVVKTRMMNQPFNSNHHGLLYKSSIDCLMKTVREEGFFALYKGFVPIWARMAPWSLTFWISYEEIRKLTGSSSF